MEQTFVDAASKGECPGVVLLAADRSGRFRYANSFGAVSANEPQRPIALDHTIWMASWTKLMTAIATLQCVENGLISFHQDVSPILPEIGCQPILTGFDKSSKKPIFTKREAPMTVLQLLTHTAGLSYDVFSPLLRKWRAYRGEAPGSGADMGRFTYPLIYEPGTSWEYSCAHDWLGVLIGRINGHGSLGAYMKTYIWDLLNLKHITLRLDCNARVLDNLAALSKRDPSGSGKAVFTTNPLVKSPASEGGGGGGAYGQPTEFMQILESLLKDDGKLLKPEMAEELFKPRLEEFNRERGTRKIAIPAAYNDLAGFPNGTRKEWSIAGLVNCEDLDGWRRSGSVTCIGMASATWNEHAHSVSYIQWIDRELGICGLYATGMYPLHDPQTIALRRIFEKEMYKRFRSGQTKL